MISFILKKLGFVKCRVCGKWTEPSIFFGNICSPFCYNYEKMYNQLYQRDGSKTAYKTNSSNSIALRSSGSDSNKLRNKEEKMREKK